MDKTAFKPQRRYTVALRAGDKIRPANFYVYRTYDDFMVVRHTSYDGLLRKLRYADIERVVHDDPADPQHLRATPAALLEESFWKERSELAHYASSPALGK